MRVKSFYAWDDARLDKKVNAFLEQDDVEVVDIRFAASIFYMAAMVLYREPAP